MPIEKIRDVYSKGATTLMKEAHKLDGIALAKFLHWFDQEAPKGKLTEIGIVEALEHFRREEETCVDASFDTISGAGPNGAIVHYRVDERSSRTLKSGEIMISAPSRIDSPKLSKPLM